MPVPNTEQSSNQLKFGLKDLFVATGFTAGFGVAYPAFVWAISSDFDDLPKSKIVITGLILGVTAYLPAFAKRYWSQRS
ncbi:MAG: hypothetical protein KF851_00970 [Pirellulaceae bacterium]|jgi:hypothetical protein|nr:hypothetical protein [Pirellulaceae bacterium]